MSQIHLFIMDPLEKLNPKLDSSLRMAFTLHSRGHRILIGDVPDMSWNRSAASAAILARELIFGDKLSDIRTGPYQHHLLSHADMIHMRKEPPFDQSFLTATWLLDTVSHTVPVVNAPAALRDLNEKAAILQFPQYCNAALVSQNSRLILPFIREECASDAIVKPLDLFGGQGIRRLEAAEWTDTQLEAELQKLTDRNRTPRIIQPFDSRIYDGEIRVFCAGNMPIAWSKKVPKSGSFLANTSSGATLAPCNPTHQQQEMVVDVAKSLESRGIILTGFDIIGDRISEINVTSPRLLTPDPDDSAYYQKIIDIIVARARDQVQPARHT